MSPPMVEVRAVTMRFGPVTAVHEVDLTIAAGEFVTVLGPSGCGKTTLLRILAGFEIPTAGSVHLDGQDVTRTPPYRRSVNHVFQGYALFPHLSVHDNVAFGLRLKKTPRAEIARGVAEALRLVSLEGLETRRPSQLSGGQRQRVALARALVCRPKVLLLDEPLSALDARLRQAMQIELKHLQQRLGITFVFVTHDQQEALAMSDRIVVLNRGRVEQVGPASEVYHRPRSRFVAGFVGQANLLTGSIAGPGRLRISDGTELAVDPAACAPGASTLLVCLRPEKIDLHQDGRGQPAVIEDVVFRGSTAELQLRLPAGLAITALVANRGAAQVPWSPGQPVCWSVHPDDVVVVPDA